MNQQVAVPNQTRPPILKKRTDRKGMYCETNVQSDTKKGELLKNLTKIEEIQEKTFIDRN